MRIRISDKAKKVSITKPKEMADILINVLRLEDKDDRGKEHFWGIYLNARNTIVRIELIHLGTLNACLVHPRDTFKPAITSNCASIIVLHNHCSGDVEPSKDDINLTHRLKEAGDILGIELLDHLIINEQGKYYSFKVNKLIK